MGLLSAALYTPDARLGLLSDRGAFDQYGRYLPGQMVTEGGVAYLCTAPVGTEPELEDTFQRPDQAGWGQSSHGEYWQTGSGWANGNPAVITGGVGELPGTAETSADGQLLGPATLRADVELLVHVALAVRAPDDHIIVFFLVNATEDDASRAGAYVEIHSDGTTVVTLTTTTPGFVDADSAHETGPTVAAGESLWLRVRRVGLDYSATLWLHGTPEPDTPQVTHTASHAQPAGHPVVNSDSVSTTGEVRVSYLSVRPLTAATAPADDTAHWTPLSEALAVPAPL